MKAVTLEVLLDATRSVQRKTLASMPAVCARHDFRDGDVCSKCDAVPK